MLGREETTCSDGNHIVARQPACVHRPLMAAVIPDLAPAGGKEGRRAGVGKVGDKDAKFAATEILSQPGSWLAKMPPGEGNRKKFDLH